MASSLSFKRGCLLVFLLAASWCVMTVVHELGHIVCGCASGGTLRDADIAPWRLPYSNFNPDPHPLVTLWGGPLLGVLVPVGVAAIVRRGWMWLIAHFCLLANGAYLAAGWMSGERYLDTTKLLHHGAPPLAILAYCVLTISMGYVGFRRQCLRLLAPPARGAGTSPPQPIS